MSKLTCIGTDYAHKYKVCMCERCGKVVYLPLNTYVPECRCNCDKESNDSQETAKSEDK